MLLYITREQKWSDTPVMRRASADPKSAGFAGSLVSDVKLAGTTGVGFAYAEWLRAAWLPLCGMALPPLSPARQAGESAVSLRAQMNWWGMVVVRHLSLPASFKTAGLQPAGRDIPREIVAGAVKRLLEACWPPYKRWWSLPVTLRRLLVDSQAIACSPFGLLAQSVSLRSAARQRSSY